VTTLKGEIARSEPERTNEQLTGRVWLVQNRGEWPVGLLTLESQVVGWLESNPEGAAWEYHLTPMRQVKVVRPEPYLQEVYPPPPPPEVAEMEPEPEPDSGPDPDNS